MSSHRTGAGSVVVAIAVAVAHAPYSFADPVCTSNQVRVLQVFDPANLLQGLVLPNAILPAEIRYERIAPDEDPDPTVGIYHMHRFWNGLTALDARIEGEGFVFRADPSRLDVEIMVKRSDTSDQITIRSAVNLPITSFVTVDTIEWRFDDPTGSVLDTDALPQVLPVMAFAERTLVIHGRKEASPDIYRVDMGVQSSENVSCSQPDPIERAVCIDLRAVVDALDDPANVLQGSVRLNQVLRGSYVFNRACADANGLPNVGEYFHTASFYGMVLNADGTSFFTDNTNPALNVAITSGTPSVPADRFLVSSPNNAALPSGAEIVAMQWELVDADGDAITTADLPAGEPQLASWGFNSLRVEGNDGLQPPAHSFEFTAIMTQASATSCFDGPNAVDAGGAGPGAAATLPLAAATPNPFQGATAIRYRVTQPSDRVVRIYSVDGRQVRTLVAWSDALGPVTLRWDGTDDRGRAVARGTYVLRIGAGRHAPVGRLVYLGR
jgi:hypothetical protein